MVLPLDHVVVIDLSRMLPGPYGSMILADLGADVIRVEDPKYVYASPPPFFQKGRYRESAFNSIIMRNKKSITLNLKEEKARQIFYELVKKADVVLESFRPKVVNKLKIDYETLASINPSIIYCSISGYGQTGPYEQTVGHDLNYMAISGLLDMNKERRNLGQKDQKRKPVVPGYQVADIGVGLMSAIGILGAIVEKEKDPEKKGQYIDLSMTDIVFSFVPMAAAFYLSSFLNDSMSRPEEQFYGNVPYYSIYKTKDNKYLSVGCIEVKFWHELCQVLGREDLKTKGNAKGIEKEKVFSEIQNEFLKKTQAEWTEIFNSRDACVTPIKTFAEACDDPQIKARNMIVKVNHPVFGEIRNIASPIKMSKTPLTIRDLAPKVGQHTKEILKSLNFSEEEIRQFKRKGFI